MNVSKDCSSAVSQNTLSDQSISNEVSLDLIREKKQSTVTISVVLLDHSEAVFYVNKRDRGQVLFDLVFKRLKVIETKFFGLQFPNDVPDAMRWLDPAKSIRKQFRRGYPLILFFRIKFYPTDLSSMKDDYTKNQLFLQIKLDLLEKRLHCHSPIAAMIASYAVQSELGDYNFSEHQNNYISGMKFLPNQTEEFEAEVQRLHKLHTGLSPSQAEYNAIKKALKLDMYGVEIHHAKDTMDEDLDVGVTSFGILFYQNGFRIHQFKWSAIVKISFKRKQFFIQLRENPQMPHNNPELIFGFHMDNYRACKRLWKSCVDFHSFYRLDRCMNSSVHKAVTTDDITSSHNYESKSENMLYRFFPLGNKQKFRHPQVYSSDDMVQNRPNIRPQTGSAKSRDNLSVTRDDKLQKISRRLSAPSSVSYGVNSSFLSEEMDTIRANNAEIAHTGIGNLDSDRQSLKNKFDFKDISKAESTESFDVLPSPAKFPIEIHSPDPALTSTFRKFQVSPKPITSTVEVGNNKIKEIESYNGSYSHLEKAYLFPDKTTLPFPYQSSGNRNNGIAEGLHIIKLTPDEDGKYGFNVKGGADQNAPITISKVVKGSPASLCVPHLNVGDHVIQINGRDVSGHSHDQVVRFIRSTSDYHSTQLVLLVSPAEINFSSNQLEAFLQPMFSQKAAVPNSLLDEGALLHSSMQWLEDMLESGELLTMFNDLYRRKPGSTMADARLPVNSSKNRYRDISPYDDTRVHLKYGSTDYINANHVNMFIPGTNWTNFYVASQGPLLNTTADFWSMIWELKANLIIMLTTVVEGGRPKCHQYWPDSGNIIQFGQWKIESISEKITHSFAYRDFLLNSCTDDPEEISKPRLIRQMQYTAWPDHDVPKDSSDFLDFVLQVRQNRIGITVPCIVHCSAGIGRTGVLITMETAMCLMEANQPVYPIEITRTMRDQRAMMIQTPNQFRFVCEAILRVYKEGLAKPMISDYDEHENSDIDEDSSDDILNTTS